MPTLLAVASSLMWGLADFAGGKASRRHSALLVVLISQTAGLIAAVVVGAANRSFADPNGYLPWALGAGLAGACAVVLFYRALAIGTMGVVAPIAALGVVVPVVLGLVGGNTPSLMALVGLVVAVAGVVATARVNSSVPRTRGSTRPVLLAVGSSVGFGLLQYAISGGSQYSTVMTMVTMRATSVPLLAVVAYVALRRGHGSDPARGVGRMPSLLMLALLALIGVLDVSANLLFALATVSGPLAIVAVLGSLYPAVTVLLARAIDNEHLSTVQDVGVLIALTGVVMISVGA